MTLKEKHYITVNQLLHNNRIMFLISSNKLCNILYFPLYRMLVTRESALTTKSGAVVQCIIFTTRRITLDIVLIKYHIKLITVSVSRVIHTLSLLRVDDLDESKLIYAIYSRNYSFVLCLKCFLYTRCFPSFS